MDHPAYFGRMIVLNRSYEQRIYDDRSWVWPYNKLFDDLVITEKPFLCKMFIFREKKRLPWKQCVPYTRLLCQAFVLHRL